MLKQLYVTYVSNVMLPFLTRYIHSDWFLTDFCFLFYQTQKEKKSFHMSAFSEFKSANVLFIFFMITGQLCRFLYRG